MTTTYTGGARMVAHNMVTTQFELDGFRVTRTLGVVRGIVVRSRSIFGTIGPWASRRRRNASGCRIPMCRRALHPRSGRREGGAGPVAAQRFRRAGRARAAAIGRPKRRVEFLRARISETATGVECDLGGTAGTQRGAEH